MNQTDIHTPNTPNTLHTQGKIVPHVMVVDDDATFSESLREMLQDIGYSVSVAKNGEEAFYQAQSSTPSLIVLDQFMPSLTGIGFMEKLRAEAWGRDIPVIVFTSYNLQDLKDMNEQYNVEQHLLKTEMSLADITEVIHRRLGDVQEK